MSDTYTITTRAQNRTRRGGFSVVELLLVIVIVSIIYFRIAPAFSELKARSALRAARMEVASTFAAARAAAMQKGRTATLILSNVSAKVTVASAITGAPVTLVGPITYYNAHGTTLSALNAAPTTIVFDGRGLIAPASATIQRYRLTSARWSDTICVSGAGIVLPRGCQL
jgi:Tfp pilus assembly protein FimT